MVGPAQRVQFDPDVAEAADQKPARNQIKLEDSAKEEGKLGLKNTPSGELVGLHSLQVLAADSYIPSSQLKTVKRLGEGAFAYVDLCWYTPPNGQRVMVAVKRIKPDMFNDPTELQCFIQEARILQRMQHPYVVECVGVGDLDGDPRSGGRTGERSHAGMYLVQEYMGAGTLKNQVLKQQLSVGRKKVYQMKDALRWSLQIAKALRYLHNAKPMIIHRDLKLENILLVGPTVSTMVAKVADFGLCACIDSWMAHKLVAKSDSTPSSIEDPTPLPTPPVTDNPPPKSPPTSSELASPAPVTTSDAPAPHPSLPPTISSPGTLSPPCPPQDTPGEPAALPLTPPFSDTPPATSEPSQSPSTSQPSVAPSTPENPALAPVEKPLPPLLNSEIDTSLPPPIMAAAVQGVPRPSSLAALPSPFFSPPPPPPPQHTPKPFKKSPSFDPRLLLVPPSPSILQGPLPLTKPLGTSKSVPVQGSQNSEVPAKSSHRSHRRFAGAKAKLKELGSTLAAWVAPAPSMPRNPSDVYRLSGYTGSLLYMAPEVFLMKPYNQKVDVFSFGVLLLELFNGTVLSTVVAPKRTIKEVEAYARGVATQGVRLEIPPSVPDTVAKLIRECWEENPELRPNMDEVVKRLEMFQESLMVNEDKGVEQQSGVCGCLGAGTTAAA